nr:hypothetical protein [Tanacetum cinerariifolium]
MIIHLQNRRKNIMLRKNVSRESMLNTSVDNDSQREEIDIVTSTDDVLPPGVKNDDDSDGEIDAVEELHASDFDNPSVPRPPSEPPDDKFDFEPDSKKEISVVMNGSNEFEYLDPRDEFNDDNYSSFTFVIYSKMFLSFLS